MKLTLNHQTSQEKAIKIIDDYLNYLLSQKYPGVEIIDPEKKWQGNFMRFYFVAEKIFWSLEISGTLIINDESAILEGEIPAIVTTFVPEEKIKKIITEKFNQLFNL
ncbi:MAG TPA: hypothetical protein VJG65_00345 [Patescibacteria group bacterium]|nr:hypothetical protein [Patescibacteria group bacterium]